MSNTLFRTGSYLSYWLNAVDQHSLHSPFFFDLYRNIIRQSAEPLHIAEQLRAKLLEDNRTVSLQDYGTGAKRSAKRTVRDIARTSLSTLKFSSLYRRIVQRYEPKVILELGTSLGINTLYLNADENAKIVTFEGSGEVSSIADVTFQFAQAKNIQLVQGNIDTTLPSYLSLVKKIDLAFIDANHTYEATMRYFKNLLAKTHDKSVIVIDDIHYSAGMEKAWHEIRKNDLVYASADLYRCGILWFDPSLNKQHVILQF